MLFILIASGSFFHGSAQDKRSSDIGIRVAAGPSVPIGEFTKSHNFGAGIEIAAARHNFRLQGKQKFAFTYSGGFTWYHGITKLVPDVAINYPDYSLIHAIAGGLYHPSQNLNITLQAGPALGFYRKDTRFNIVAALVGGYFFNGTWSLHPSVWMMKESKSDPVWAASLKLGYSF